MPSLSTELRRQLEAVVIDARDVADAAARSALQKRAVHEAKPFPHFTEADRKSRNRLRARGTQAVTPGTKTVRSPSTNSLKNWPTNTGIGCSSPASWQRTIC